MINQFLAQRRKFSEKTFLEEDIKPQYWRWKIKLHGGECRGGGDYG